MERFHCRLCGGAVKKVFELKPSAIANSYPEEPGSEKYPLELMQCGDCGHVQQRYVIPGLFKDYKYRTPAEALKNTHPVADMIAAEKPGCRVLEIGCNNGAFLDALKARGLEPLGVDPSSDHPRALKAYFGMPVARWLDEFDAVVGLNVFAHIDNLDSVFKGIDKVLAPDGVLIFEVQYLVDLVRSGEFDLVYHEHLDYHTLKPLQAFLRRYNLVMTEWEHIPAHGGSIRVVARRNGIECAIPDEPLDWAGLREKIDATGRRLRAVLASHGKVVAFGAAAKATTLINELGIADYIKFAVDDTPEKQGRFIPGTGIPILNSGILNADDVVLVTAWNYFDVIAQKIPNKLIHPFEARDSREG